MKKKILALTTMAALTLSGSVFAAQGCAGLPSHAEAEAALTAATAGVGGGGLDFDMWITIVDHDGVVCAVAGADADENGEFDPWLGSRVISAQKANTANAFSTNGFALSTANIYSAVNPGGSLYGLQHSNPVDVAVYAGDNATFGTAMDPMVGMKPGGVNVFGGGLALYDADGVLLGALGVSGDFSCADHNIAWLSRYVLALDNVPAGVGANSSDAIVYGDVGGWNHPSCGGGTDAVSATLESHIPMDGMPVPQ